MLAKVFAAPMTLEDSFMAAKKNMESIKRSESMLKQSLERKRQAVATLLPTIRAVGNETRIDKPSSPTINKAFVLTRQYSAALRLEQPLIRGGSYSALKLREEEVLLNEFYQSFQEITLYQLVIRAYFDVIKAQADLESLKELLTLSEARERELRNLASLGRSRKTELVQAEAQTLGARAQIKQGTIFLNEAKEDLSFLTGTTVENLQGLKDLPEKIDGINFYLQKLDYRPDILAKNQEVRVAEHKTAVMKGGHYPSADLVGNYYFDRTGILQTSEWDVGVVVSIPLFQGGSVSSQIREALEAKRTAELNRVEFNRSAKRDLSVLYYNYHELHSQLDILKSAVKKSQEAYNLNLKDYRLGQITNLEVLQSLNLYMETKRNYQNILVDTHYHLKNLEASVGVHP